MKTKMIKRVLTCVMAIVMTFSVCTIVSSAATLQALIDATEDGGTLILSQNYNESVVIDKAITIDLNGHQISGKAGERAIVVNADATIKNGKIVSNFADVTSMEMLKRVKSEAFAAIKATADVTLENVCVVGAKTRVPATNDSFFPTGSAVETIGANTDVVLKNATLIGRYGVNNAITNHTAGGNVKIEDAVVFGFMGAVKDESKIIVDADSEKVNSTELISELLVETAFSETETDFINSVLSDSCFVCAKSPSVSTPVVSDGYITAQADESNDVEPIGFSYKWVPESVILDGGATVEFILTDGEYKAQIAEDKAEVSYRLWAEMSSDINDYIVDFAGTAGELITELEDVAGTFVKTFDDKYDDYVKLVSKAYYKFDEIGADPIPVVGGTFSDIEEFYDIQKAMFELGGKKMYEAALEATGDESYTFGVGTYNYFFGTKGATVAEIKAAFEAAGGIEGNYGVLDYVDDYVDEFKALGIEDSANWVQAAEWRNIKTYNHRPGW